MKSSFSTAALAIPDSPKAGVKSSLAVNSAPKGRQVQVKVDLVHTYKGDLLVELLSPDGKSSHLAQQKWRFA